MIIDDVELKRRHSLRIAGARDKKAYIGPQTVVLKVNHSCNLSCRHCWAHSPGNPAHLQKDRLLSWERFLEIVRDSIDLKVDQIHLTGGEPTLHPLFRKMMRHLEQQPLKVKVLTNATFPSAYCSDVIKADHALIDLSAVDPQQYRDLQGKDLFDRVVSNIERLAALRDSGKPGFTIEIAYIVNAFNIHQKQKMRDLASRLGVNSVYFSRMNVHEYNREIALPQGPMSDLEGEEKSIPPVCLNGWFYMITKPDDHISTCCRIQQGHLGNFDQWSFKQLWSSPRMMNIRLLGKYGYIQKMHKACQTCPFYEENIQRARDLAGVEKNEQAIA